MEEKAMKWEIHRELRQMGVGRYKGFRPLVDVIWYAVENEDYLHRMTSDLFPLIAEKYQTNPAALTGNFRAIINACWKDSNRQLLLKLIGRELEEKPTVSDFIGDLANYFMRLG